MLETFSCKRDQILLLLLLLLDLLNDGTHELFLVLRHLESVIVVEGRVGRDEEQRGTKYLGVDRRLSTLLGV